MQTVGVLCVRTNPTGDDEYSIVNPDHPYVVLTPDECPDAVLPLVKALADRGEFMPLGIVVDPEVNLDE